LAADAMHGVQQETVSNECCAYAGCLWLV